MTATTPSVDLDELEHTIQDRIEQLQARRQELSLDALSKTSAKTELQTVEKKLAAAESELSRLALARSEQTRRQEQARQAEIEQDRRQALEKAQTISTERHAVAVRVDEATRELAAVIAEHRDAVFRQSVQMELAGRKVHIDHARLVQRALEHALVMAFGDAGVRSAIELPPISVREVKPFVEGDPAPRFAFPLGVSESSDAQPAE